MPCRPQLSYIYYSVYQLNDIPVQ